MSIANDNYVVYHCHSDLSSGITNIDSVTKYKQYVEYAQSLGMTALGFSEHGNIFEWVHKKEAIEAAGMKYLHGVEAYLTSDKDANDKHRDNYHCVLIAKNYDGVKELNKLVSASFNRSDYHYYYAPRIGFDELYKTSDNIIITTACLGGVLNKADNIIKTEFLKFLIKNKHRCYLEIQHHNCEDQAKYNKILYTINQKTGVPLIAGTDTHCLNEIHVEGRSILYLYRDPCFLICSRKILQTVNDRRNSDKRLFAVLCVDIVDKLFAEGLYGLDVNTLGEFLYKNNVLLADVDYVIGIAVAERILKHFVRRDLGDLAELYYDDRSVVVAREVKLIGLNINITR